MRRAYLISLPISFLLALACCRNFVSAQTAATSTPAATSTAQTMTREDLQTQVQEKAKQLDDLNKQIEATKQALSETTGNRLTLQKELATLQNNVDQLSLSIKADQITIEELGLEVESLGYDLTDIQSSIADKKAAIIRTIVEVQMNDENNNNLLMVFLQSKTLADGVLEAQNIKNLQDQLTTDITNLHSLHDEYDSKIQEATQKKESIAFNQQDLTNKKLIVQDQKTEQQTVLTQTKNKESVYEKQVADLEKQQQQIADEVEALDAVLRTKIDPSTLPPLGHGVLAIPVSGDTLDDITQGYGATEFAKNGYQGHWHNGVDFAASIGTPVLAAEDGTVVATGNQDSYCPRGAYGKFIVIQHTDNLTTLYGHLSRQIVAKGDTIKRGQVIGYSGMTGYATGPHLHFSVFASPTFYMGPSKVCGPMPFGGDLNPLGYL